MLVVKVCLCASVLCESGNAESWKLVTETFFLDSSIQNDSHKKLPCER